MKRCTCRIIEGPEDIIHQKCPLCKAGPKLLEACESAFDAISSTDELFRYEHRAVIQQLETAIAKADPK